MNKLKNYSLNIQVLLSTMNIRDYKKQLHDMNVKNNYVIINQKTDYSIKSVNINKKFQKVLTYNEKGLSKSRNKAIFFCDSDIGVLSDDDMYYYDNYEEIIKSAYKKYSDADIICFSIDYEDKNKIKNKYKAGRIGYIRALRISSVQITFKTKRIKEKYIMFDESFGAGSKYGFGEDNIFLYDCLKEGLKIYYIPINIGILKEKHNSSWFNGFNEKYLKNRGACFYRMTNIFWPILNFQFIIRKFKLFKENITFCKALNILHLGSMKYKKECKIKNRIFFVGDFYSNSGPANVNKNIKKILGKKAKYSIMKKKYLRIVEYLLKVLFSENICFCSFSKFNVIGIKIAKKLNKKTFYLMHGYSKLENEINGSHSVQNDKIEDFILNNVNKTICVSKKLKEIMKSKDYKCKFVYVFNGLDWYFLLKNNMSNNKETQILSTGGDMPRKNNIKVCKAIEEINKSRKEEDEIIYIIIGKSYGYKKNIEKYSFVKFYEEVSYEECLNFMKESKIYIQNSSFDTFGLAPIEALANGCDLLLSEKLGCLDLFSNIKANDIIKDCDDVEEIKLKINSLLSDSNNQRLFNSIDLYQSSINHRVEELVNKIMEGNN